MKTWQIILLVLIFIMVSILFLDAIGVSVNFLDADAGRGPTFEPT